MSEDKDFDEYLNRQLFGAKTRKINQAIKEDRYKYIDADCISYNASYKIAGKKRNAKGYFK
jgi:hypothetical protein